MLTNPATRLQQNTQILKEVTKVRIVESTVGWRGNTRPNKRSKLTVTQIEQASMLCINCRFVLTHYFPPVSKLLAKSSIDKILR